MSTKKTATIADSDDNFEIGQGRSISEEYDGIDCITEPEEVVVKESVPALVSIGGGKAKIGTSKEDFEKLFSKYRSLGVSLLALKAEVPAANVILKPFRIGKYCVTNKEYRNYYLTSRYAEVPSSWPNGCYPEDRANHPVFSVSQRTANDYCNWLSQATGRNFRLPSDWEWEYCARGPEDNVFPWGDTFNTECANTMEAFRLTTTPVSQFPEGASSLGVMDMAGNVEEHVVPDTANQFAGESVAKELCSITKGGSFLQYEFAARAANMRLQLNVKLNAIGFRVAEDLHGN